jgi:hypothetical protein
MTDQWEPVEYLQKKDGERRHVWREEPGAWSGRTVRLSDDLLTGEALGTFVDEHEAMAWASGGKP